MSTEALCSMLSSHQVVQAPRTYRVSMRFLEYTLKLVAKLHSASLTTTLLLPVRALPTSASSPLWFHSPKCCTWNSSCGWLSTMHPVQVSSCYLGNKDRTKGSNVVTIKREIKICQVYFRASLISPTHVLVPQGTQCIHGIFGYWLFAKRNIFFD